MPSILCPVGLVSVSYISSVIMHSSKCCLPVNSSAKLAKHIIHVSQMSGSINSLIVLVYISITVVTITPTQWTRHTLSDYCGEL